VRQIKWSARAKQIGAGARSRGEALNDQQVAYPPHIDISISIDISASILELGVTKRRGMEWVVQSSSD
jgi:hypothetical protein